MRTLTIYALVALAMMAAPSKASLVCTYYFDQEPSCVEVADYYTVLTTEPNWCLYQHGDQIFGRYTTDLHQTGWYVIPESDRTSPAPSDFNNFPYAFANGDCSLFTIFVRY